jgi:hypothetical protein
MAAVAALVVAGNWASAGTAHAEPEPPRGPRTTIDADGTYAVGTDIVAGTYNSAGPVADGACYWKRLNGSEIVDNALTKKPQRISVEPDDTAFATNNCQPWQLSACDPGCGPAPATPQDLLGDLSGFIATHQGALAPGGTP